MIFQVDFLIEFYDKSNSIDIERVGHNRNINYIKTRSDQKYSLINNMYDLVLENVQIERKGTKISDKFRSSILYFLKKNSSFEIFIVILFCNRSNMLKKKTLASDNTQSINQIQRLGSLEVPFIGSNIQGRIFDNIANIEIKQLFVNVTVNFQLIE